ncbi:ARM repeat-containing protein [Atractiella rhizophila]|nr:ARM repeat-containing protein [Atractiella rhizophila]
MKQANAQDFPQRLHALLLTLSSPAPGQSLTPFTSTLQGLYKSPNTLPTLFQIALEAPEEAVRQLAAVEARKRVVANDGKAWKRISNEKREAIKNGLMEKVGQESTSNLRNALARVMSSIASHELPAEEWPSLLPWLWNSSLPPTPPQQREVCTYVVFTLVDVVTTHEELSKHIEQILQLLAKTIEDPESLATRVNSVRALGRLTDAVEGESAQMETILSAIPSISKVMQGVVDQKESNLAKHVFDVFEDLFVIEGASINRYIPDLFSFWLSTASTPSVPEDIRQMAISAILWAIRYRKNAVTEFNLTKPLVDGLMVVCTDDEPEDPEEDSPATLAFRTFDSLSNLLPASLVFPPVWDQVRLFADNPDPRYRKAAAGVLGVVMEGCASFIQPHVSELWPLILKFLADPDASVRGSACLTLSALCEELRAEVIIHHQTLLPMIVEILKNEHTRKKGINCLDAFLEILEEEHVTPYLPDLMTTIIALLDAAPTELKPSVVGAVGSAAHASKKNFTPYFQGSMERLLPFLDATAEEDLELRGVTQDTVGTLAEAVGKEAFQPFFQVCMEKAFEGLKIEGSKMKECSFIFFAVMARVYEEDFAASLPTVMPVILAGLGQEDDEVELSGEGSSLLQRMSGGIATEEDLDETAADDEFEMLDDDDDIDSKVFEATTAMAMEKEIAADAMCELASYCKGAFVPYMEESTKMLLPLVNHIFSGVQCSAVSALMAFVQTGFELTHIDIPRMCENRTNLTTQKQLIFHHLPYIIEYVRILMSDSSRDVVDAVATEITNALVEVGPGLLPNQLLQEVCKHIVAILDFKAKCQQVPDSVVSEDLNAHSEQESTLLTSALDLIGSIATAYQSQFLEALPLFKPFLLKFIQPSAPMKYRASAAGTLAEIINGLGQSVTQFTEELYPIIISTLQSSEPEVQSNCAFALGSLVLHSQTDMSSQYSEILRVVYPLLQAPDDAPSQNLNAKDNAAAVIARLILKNVDALPLAEVVPVFVGALPLKKDMTENSKMFSAVGVLISRYFDLVAPHFDHILQVFAHALASPEEGKNAQLNKKTRENLIQLVKALGGQHGDRLRAAGLGAYL